jgi:hypothetical protein
MLAGLARGEPWPQFTEIFTWWGVVLVFASIDMASIPGGDDHKNQPFLSNSQS